MSNAVVSGEGPKIKLNVNSNLGYGADQVKGITLGEMLEAVQEAIIEWVKMPRWCFTS